MNRHVVIGASGLVGRHILAAVADVGTDVVGTYYQCSVDGMSALDIRSSTSTEQLLKRLRPSVVFLPAAKADVDYCERHASESYAINVLGCRNVVAAANAVGAKLVYFSSDYVFDGQDGPYREDDPANPICEYGRQKLIAEQYVALHARDYLIVRTTVVYGWESQGKNFVHRLLKTLKAGQILRAPVDQIGSPTYAPNLAQAVVELALSDARGVYHVVGPDRVDRYTFAQEIALAFGLLANLVRPVSTKELGQLAQRPLIAGMVMDKAAARLRLPLVGYKDGLRAMASCAVPM